MITADEAESERGGGEIGFDSIIILVVECCIRSGEERRQYEAHT